MRKLFILHIIFQTCGIKIKFVLKLEKNGGFEDKKEKRWKEGKRENGVAVEGKGREGKERKGNWLAIDLVAKNISVAGLPRTSQMIG